MNIDFFGLDKPPFPAQATGTQVFMGPQQARLASGLKKALAESDAVVALSGPVGSGKTVSLSRALDSFGADKSIVRIDRMPLSRSEVLEAMLLEFGLDVDSKSTPQRFAAFRRRLNEHESASKRVIIVVEDACRLGVDALAELESLTSADSGAGANLIVLGPPETDELLQAPELARLQQRIRLRQTLLPFSAAEVRGYLVHRVRAAGADCDALFAGDAVTALHECSHGIPRVINGLCNRAMMAAADRQQSTVTADDIRQVAREEFGYTESPRPADAAAAAQTNAVVNSSAGSLTDSETENPANTDAQEPAATAASAEADLLRGQAESEPLVIPDEIDVPDLIQDTLPRIKALKDPNDVPTPAEALEAMRNKTHHTQPSLPVLGLGTANSPEPAPSGADAAEALQEPRAPEPLSDELTDTQTTRALDSALRPDTQLLEALDVNVPVLRDTTPQTNGEGSASAADDVPTLSDSMRLDVAAPGKARTPSIDELQCALDDAREGSERALQTGSQPALVLKPEASAQPAGNEAHKSTQGDQIPAITLDDDMQQQQEEARARLAAEAEKAAAALAKIEKKPTAAELAKAREIEAEKKRLAGMASVAAQFDAGDELRLEDTQSSKQPPAAAVSPAATAAPAEAAAPSRLEKLAAELGRATSLEEIDDVAAETLFGQEFSQLAATIVESAANDIQASAETAMEAPVVEVAAQAGSMAAKPRSAPTATEPTTGSPDSSVTLQTINGASAPTQSRNTQTQPSATPNTAPTAPMAASAPRTVPPPGPLDESAAKRLEMVRSLNKGKMPPPVNTTPGENIVLGSDDIGPTHAGPSPDLIENQFGTSMTANLKALSETSMDAMRKAEAQTETTEKKGGLLSRFRRS